MDFFLGVQLHFTIDQYLKDVKEQGIKDYADEIVALYMLIEQYKKY